LRDNYIIYTRIARKVHAIGINVHVRLLCSFQPLKDVKPSTKGSLGADRVSKDCLDLCVGLRPAAAQGDLLKLSPPIFHL